MRFLILPFLCAMAIGSAAGDQQASADRGRQAYLRAIEIQKTGDHSGALSLLWEAAGLAPHDADLQNALGEALERIGALDAAIDAYRAALAARPESRIASNHLVLALVKAGKGAEAVRLARATAAGAPDDPELLFTLGLAQSEQSEDEAVATFRRVLAMAPRHTLARYNLALVLKRADRLAEAVAELEQALALEPRAEAHYTLGVIYWHQGDTARAIRALRAAVAAQPDYAEAHHSLGAVLKSAGDLKGAAAALRQSIALRPDLPASHYALGQVLQSAGDARGGAAELAEAEQLRERAQVEREAAVWTSVGMRRLDGGDPEAAVDCFRRAVAVFESYAPAHYQMGRAFQRLDKEDAARAAFARARQLNPSLVAPPGKQPEPEFDYFAGVSTTLRNSIGP